MEYIKDLSLSKLEEILLALKITVTNKNDILEIIPKIMQSLVLHNIDTPDKLEYVLLKNKWQNIELLQLFNIAHPLIPECSNINNINQNIQCLTDSSNNGFITLINYQKGHVICKGVLKSIKISYDDEDDDDEDDDDEECSEDEDEDEGEDKDEDEDECSEDEDEDYDSDEDDVQEEPQEGKPDNLYYEYLVGNCVNKLSLYFPNFVKTFGAGMYRKAEYHEFFNNGCETKDLVTLPDKFITMINPLNADNIEQNIINSCDNWSQMVLITQWIPSHASIADFLPQIVAGQEPLMIEYIKLLYIIYLTLSSLKDTFTHYDLHEENILLTKVPNNKYISLIYHLPNGETRVINTKYIPVFIDYGRSYVNCDSPILNSKEIFNIVCNNEKQCPIRCGDYSGYSFSGNIKPDGTFGDTNRDDFYINSAKRNMSHDLRLISDIKSNYDYGNLNSRIQFIRLWKNFISNLNYTDTFGTPEAINVSQSSESLIYNVVRAHEELDKIILDPSFVAMDNIEVLYEKFGNINIMTDMSSEFIFTPN